MRLFEAIIDANHRAIAGVGLFWALLYSSIVMNTLERIREILVTLSPERREQVMRFVQSLDEPAYPLLKGGNIPQNTTSKHESKNCN